jgi:cytochrome b
VEVHAVSPPRLSPAPSLPVWDLPTRLYHWLQAVLVASALATGFLAPEWWLGVHVWLGYGVAGLIVFRLIWGAFGSEFSRFTSFVFSPRQTWDHIRGLIKGRPARTIGHNPLGALMVFAMIATLSGIGISGLIALGGEENQGPLAGFVGFALGEAAKEAHVILAIALMAMIALHILGVFVESRLGRESLIRAMITGRKRLPAGALLLNPRPARRRAATLAAVCAGAVFISIGSLASLVPASGLIAMPRLAAFQEECGECHEVYHPSLLPRISWSAMMAGLENHFGEDASLSPNTAQAIATYLDKFASESWDTEAANRLRVVDGTVPTQITATPFWKRKHRKIESSVFETKPLRGRGNCAACHRDAGSGRFDDQMIALPAL